MFPEEKDLNWLEKENIVGILKRPEVQKTERRLFKFDINYNEW